MASSKLSISVSCVIYVFTLYCSLSAEEIRGGINGNTELSHMFKDLRNLVTNLNQSYHDVLSEIHNEGTLRPIWLQVQMLLQYMGSYDLNPENHSMQSLDDQILSLKSDVENSELIVSNLLLFNQVRLDPKLSSGFHQVQFSLRALHYHVNTIAQYLYNSWQSQAISDPYKV